MVQKTRRLRAYTFSDHHGVSCKGIPDRKIKEAVNQFATFQDQMVYAHNLYEERCILGCPGYHELGYKDPSFDVIKLIEKVHPDDLDEVYRLTNKAFNALASQNHLHQYRYNVTYRIKKTDHQYIRVLRETIPYLADQNNKIIFTISRYTDISHLGHPREIKSWITGPNETITLSNGSESILSKREREILHYLAKGLSSKVIAKQLSISKLTVDKHRANMLQKTETNNTSELIRFALEKDILVF